MQEKPRPIPDMEKHYSRCCAAEKSLQSKRRKEGRDRDMEDLLQPHLWLALEARPPGWPYEATALWVLLRVPALTFH